MTYVKKFLYGFGGLLIAAGIIGLINHISIAIKSVQAEQALYGGSIQFMMLQMISTFQPYFTCLIGGGFLIAITAFLEEYKKRSELTRQLLQALSNEKGHNHQEIKQAASNDANDVEQISVNASIAKIPDEVNEQDDRVYWQG